MTAGLLIFILLVGVPLFLLAEHPLAFWLLFLPAAILIFIKLILWLKE